MNKGGRIDTKELSTDIRTELKVIIVMVIYFIQSVSS